MQSTAKDAISLETLLNTKREDLPRGIRYVTGGAVFRQHKASSDESNNKPELLVIKRSKNDVFPGHWEVPGGSMEFGETVLQGLKREVFEETGLDVENVVTRLEDNVFESGNNPPRKWIQFHFIVTVKSTDEVKLDPNEHEEWKWVTEESVRGLQRLPGQINAMREAFAFAKGNRMALKL